MKDNATIWISGTMHNIFSVGQILTELGFKILNVITWEKSNPPPNFSCRFFTHSTEQIIWARKEPKIPHYYNYELMKKLNGGKQMKDVWTLPAIAPWEKSYGKHPTQKPLALLTRLILASTHQNAWILDPFAGSSTTGIAANLANRRFMGIDLEEEFMQISKNRRLEIENPKIAGNYTQKLRGFTDKKQLSLFLKAEEPNPELKVALGFCRSKDLKALKTKNTFHFHAEEENDKIKDFPIGILDAKKLFIYSGGRSNPNLFTGNFADIESIVKKHKSDIKGKQNSTTKYYYEIKLKGHFMEDESLKRELKPKLLFEASDTKNPKMIRQYLPALTTLDRILKHL